MIQHRKFWSYSSRNCSNFFFYQGFLWQTRTTHMTAGEEKGPFFIPLYHFYSLLKIQTFICNFAREMAITYFLSQRSYLPDCYSMRFTTLSNYYLIDWWCDIDFCLLACWILFRFCYSYFTEETGGLRLELTIILILQANRLVFWCDSFNMKYPSRLNPSYQTLRRCMETLQKFISSVFSISMSAFVGLLVEKSFVLSRFSPYSIFILTFLLI